MNIRKTPTGLYTQADTNDRHDIGVLRDKLGDSYAAEAQFIADFLPDFEQVQPEEVGALTDAPLISDGENVYGFMAYQVQSLLKELEAGEEVFWQKG